MVAECRGCCPQQQGWADPARGRWAWWPRRCGCRPCFVTVSTSPASVRRPVSGASVQCPSLPVHATAVQCSVWASERPCVRRPMSGVDVRCPRAPASAVSDREVVEGGGGVGSRVAGMAGVGVVACGVYDRLLDCANRKLVIEAGAGCWASGGVGLDLAVVLGAGRQRPSRPRGGRGGAGCARIAPLLGSPGGAARWRLRSVVIVSALGSTRLVATGLPGWAALTLAAAARPQHAVSAARSTLATL
jgi:hypothetical protein